MSDFIKTALHLRSSGLLEYEKPYTTYMVPIIEEEHVCDECRNDETIRQSHQPLYFDHKDETFIQTPYVYKVTIVCDRFGWVKSQEVERISMNDWESYRMGRNIGEGINTLPLFQYTRNQTMDNQAAEVTKEVSTMSISSSSSSTPAPIVVEEEKKPKVKPTWQDEERDKAVIEQVATHIGYMIRNNHKGDDQKTWYDSVPEVSKNWALGLYHKSSSLESFSDLLKLKKKLLKCTKLIERYALDLEDHDESDYEDLDEEYIKLQSKKKEQKR